MALPRNTFSFFATICIALATVFYGCIPQRKVVYFQKDSNDAADSVYVNQDYEFTIAPFDILALQITGMANEEGQNVVAPFNTPVVAAGMGGDATYATGIVVDKDGDITLLYAGKVRLAGLTLGQAADKVRAALSRYIIDSGNNVTVNLKIMNYSVMVLGEVATQGIVRAENEFMTVAEVLTRSGGITDFGNRETVRIIRTNRITKQTTTYRLDLTEQTAISPIHSRLQPGDVVLVDPLRRKQYSTASQVIGIVSTFVTVPLLLLNLYRIVQP